ncbi:MAG: hypothetical protein MUC81_06350 [Bacteroidia bacterium]|jgi:hypothetical protein|nr:hypothetical protein [Bacteroidia bacterium]
MKTLSILLLGFGFTLPVVCGKSKKNNGGQTLNYNIDSNTSRSKMALFGPIRTAKVEKKQVA